MSEGEDNASTARSVDQTGGGSRRDAERDEAPARPRAEQDVAAAPDRETPAAAISGDPQAAPSGTQAEDRSRAKEELVGLLAGDETQAFRGRWEPIQAAFVDQPRASLEQADKLVAELMQRLTARFAQERENLESQWSHGDDASTEDLRVALQYYRSFFERLLSA
jgi:hypothetical protein